MKKSLLLRIVLGTALLLGGLVCLREWSNPLRRPDHELRAWIFEKTARGTTSEQVRTVANKHGWFDPWRQRADGLTYGPYIRGNLGSYWSGAVRVYVSAIWEFNPSNRLSQIRIWKTVTPP
jgi:hypothetical protein